MYASVSDTCVCNIDVMVYVMYELKISSGVQLYEPWREILRKCEIKIISKMFSVLNKFHSEYCFSAKIQWNNLEVTQIKRKTKEKAKRQINL